MITLEQAANIICSGFVEGGNGGKDGKPNFKAPFLNHKYGFDRGLRASLTNMKAFNIDIPIKPDGSFDLDAQKSLAESLLCLRQTRKTIYEKMTQLMTQKIEF